MLRSNSAKTPILWNLALPAGVVVSTRSQRLSHLPSSPVLR
jgi:hypothetical protein